MLLTFKGVLIGRMCIVLNLLHLGSDRGGYNFLRIGVVCTGKAETRGHTAAPANDRVPVWSDFGGKASSLAEQGFRNGRWQERGNVANAPLSLRPLFCGLQTKTGFRRQPEHSRALE